MFIMHKNTISDLRSQIETQLKPRLLAELYLYEMEKENRDCGCQQPLFLFQGQPTCHPTCHMPGFALGVRWPPQNMEDARSIKNMCMAVFVTNCALAVGLSHQSPQLNSHHTSKIKHETG